MNRRSLILSALAAPLSPVRQSAPLSGFALEAGRVVLSGPPRIAGQAVLAAFDTGAEISSVSQNLADRLQLHPVGSLMVNTTAGRVRRPLVRIDLNLTGGSLTRQRALVMPDLMQHGVECVVGGGQLNGYRLQFSSGQIITGASGGSGLRLRADRSSVPIAVFDAGGDAHRMVVDSGADMSSLSYDVGVLLAAKPDTASLYYDTTAGPRLRAIRLSARSGELAVDNLLLRVRSPAPSLSTNRSAIAGLLGTDFMQSFDWSVSRGENGVFAREISAPSQTWFGMGIDFRSDSGGSGEIVGLARGGPGALAGLRPGDRLVSLNGVMPTDAERLKAVGACACEEVIEVVFERGSTRNVARLTTAPLI